MTLEKINRLHQKKAYRPVVVAMIQNQSNQFLAVQSVKGDKPWGFPQGGIDLGETAALALFREVQEEVAIVADQLTIINDQVYYQKNDAPADRIDRRGFSKGKAYFFVHCHYTGAGALTLQPEELNDYHWVTLDELDQLLLLGRPCKREMTLKALKELT